MRRTKLIGHFALRVLAAFGGNAICMVLGIWEDISHAWYLLKKEW